MSKYKKILIAVDLSNESKAVIEQGLNFCTEECKPHIVHVMSSLRSVIGDIPYGLPSTVSYADMSGHIQKSKRDGLNALLDEFDLEHSQGHILEGNPADAIKKYAQENLIDLIVLGTHGQHGVQLLLGSTANSVLHAAPCDVLAVRNLNK